MLIINFWSLVERICYGVLKGLTGISSEIDSLSECGWKFKV